MKTTITTVLFSLLFTGCSYGSRYETAYEAKSACEQRETDKSGVTRYNAESQRSEFYETKCIHDVATKQYMLEVTRIEMEECNDKWMDTPNFEGWCNREEDLKRGWANHPKQPKIIERFRY